MSPLPFPPLTGQSSVHPGRWPLVRRLGIRGGLLAAFFLICAFVLLSAGAALQSALRFSEVLTAITRRQTPAMVLSLDLSRQIERFVSATDALSKVDSRAGFDAQERLLAKDRAEVEDSIAALRRIEPVQADRLSAVIGRLMANLHAIEAVVGERLTVSEKHAEASRGLRDADLLFQESTKARERVLVFDLDQFRVGRQGGAARRRLSADDPAVARLLALQLLSRLEVAFTRARDLLLIGAEAPNLAELQLNGDAVSRAMTELDQAVVDLPSDLDRIRPAIAQLHDTGGCLGRLLRCSAGQGEGGFTRRGGLSFPAGYRPAVGFDEA